jgi:hypothetical protein
MRTILPVLGFKNEAMTVVAWRPHDPQTGCTSSLRLLLSDMLRSLLQAGARLVSRSPTPVKVVAGDGGQWAKADDVPIVETENEDVRWAAFGPNGYLSAPTV